MVIPYIIPYIHCSMNLREVTFLQPHFSAGAGKALLLMPYICLENLLTSQNVELLIFLQTTCKVRQYIHRKVYLHEPFKALVVHSVLSLEACAEPFKYIHELAKYACVSCVHASGDRNLNALPALWNVCIYTSCRYVSRSYLQKDQPHEQPGKWVKIQFDLCHSRPWPGDPWGGAQLAQSRLG